MRAEILALAALLLDAGCAPRREPAAQGPTELRVPLARDVQSLDPLDASEIVTFNVVRELYEGLVDYDPRTLRVVPRLARSWVVSDDERVWTFEIRSGVRFLDDPCFPRGRGRELTADDARFAIERALRHSGRAGERPDLPAIEGLAEFLAGTTARLAGLAVASSRELRIRLARTDPRLPHFLAQARFRIVPREAVEAYGPRLREHAVGTGPFRLVSWEPLSGILLARNRNYWQTDSAGVRLPYADALRFVPFWTGDENRLFAEGRLDMVYSYALGGAAADSGRPAAAADGPGALTTPRRFFVTRLNTVFARFDFRSRHVVCRDRRLRLAVCCAAPRLRGTTHVEARGLFPPGLPGYDSTFAGQSVDLERAARLLREGGHPGGRGLPPLRIAWRDWDQGVARQIAQGLERVGLRVQLDFYPDARYGRIVGEGGADLFRDGWIADYPDPQNFLELFYSKSPENRGAYRNPQYDRLLGEMGAERDASRRLVLARRLEAMLVEDGAAVFLHHERETQFVAPRIERWEGNCTNPLNVGYYEFVGVRPALRRAP